MQIQFLQIWGWPGDPIFPRCLCMSKLLVGQFHGTLRDVQPPLLFNFESPKSLTDNSVVLFVFKANNRLFWSSKVECLVVQQSFYNSKGPELFENMMKAIVLLPLPYPAHIRIPIFIYNLKEFMYLPKAKVYPY